MIMKRLVNLILIGVAICLLMACHNEAERKISMADELVYTHPDSSLALLRQVDTALLSSAESRAYYALMWTQTAFRARRFDLVSDSLAHAAMDYYSRQGTDREKLVRSMIYLGLHYDIRDIADTAMMYYKSAESIVDTTDYRNMAQINYRIGELLLNNFASAKECAHKFERSLHYYRLLGDTVQIIISLIKAGSLYCQYGIDSALSTLQEAYELSLIRNDSARCATCLQLMARGYLKDSVHLAAKELATQCIRQYPNQVASVDALFDLASAYALMGNDDSAQYYLDRTPMPDANANRVSMRLFCQKAMAKNKNELRRYAEVNEQREHLHDSLRESTVLLRLVKMDRQETERIASLRLDEVNNRRIVLWLWLIVVVVLAAIGYCMVKRRERWHTRQLIDHIAKLSEERCELTDALERMQSSGSKLSDRLTGLLAAYSGLCDRLIDMSTAMPEVTFVKKFKAEVAAFAERGELLNELQRFIDQNNDNVLATLFEQHPSLNAKEKGIVILTAVRMRPSSVMVCMDINSESTLRVTRKRIAQKLKLPCPLVEYLADVIKNRPNFDNETQ